MVYFGGFFSKLGHFAGFSLRTVCIIYIAGRISEAVMAGEIIFLSLAGPVGYYTGNIIYQSFDGPWSSGKIYALGIPSSSLKRSILCLEISRGFLCIFRRRDQVIREAAMGGPRSSFRVRRRPVGCSVAQKGAA